MDFGYSPKVKELRERVDSFMQEHVFPAEPIFHQQVAEGDRWQPTAIVEELKVKARAAGLWNLFLPESDLGAGLTNLEYAPLAELMGRSGLASEAFNCSAPDTGNMETIVRYGSEEHKEKWLKPLLAGEIRSCFGMTEPGVASSDATNMQANARREGDEWVINGRKWWTSGACDPRCKIMIFMGLTNPDAPRHQQHSMILVPMDSPGLKVIRPLPVFGYDDAPHGHAEVVLENVRVPYSNVLLGEGRGFEIAQGRLGPGRIHHCMRSIGAAERALELMCKRSVEREAFGKRLAQLGGNIDLIAQSRIEINQARLLTLNAAYMMDTVGNKVAKSEIAQIKVVAPNVALNVIDRAIQMHGGAGVSDDFPLAHMYAMQRTLRLADGPDEVHRAAIGKLEVGKYMPR
ncbi:MULTISPECIES: acyl-CoA dehydrogenase [Halopseudomonas]|jgi:acyl-CoA dehydrogenase|uniref:Acyl-CoA dehydrogenase n=1 Tax=Halopseudomonas aestusnigri TaxID=857252 RepID=A0AAQ1G609_9GAMM|nr:MULTISPECIES: acyl-CoA dehydrogenase [Halopseudomonas]MAG68666.1 acyl-CoA dehydrogenase [Pseudomonadales bacterium]MBK59243.1 acyl-CoA dehydrogenase [Pseudomonas sp.]MAK74170.1 acyl-CoA dehydrogenase [Pseudomonadales bacterium]MAP78173.1 acyl-CoA dehydrogenase [Pseudomonadales bacterium]MCC4259156.1 acyl-CoA dehydrogenase [Halopseudomonas aestusnigri]|tara:strand:+ start:2834 stop:4042 length:1209 start_codon:yes stop_codon:yes gene_type:complete